MTTILQTAVLLLATTAIAVSQDAPKPPSGAVPATPTLTPGAASRAAQQKKVRAALYDAKADAKLQIEAALAKAAKENRRVLLQWGFETCSWCHLLHDLCTTDRALSKKLMYEYVVVHVDIGKFDKNLELAEKYGSKVKTEGAPYLTVLAADGTVLANQETSSFEVKKEGGKPGHDAAKVLEFLTRHEATPLHAPALFTAAKAAAAASNRQIFLHFGAPWCGWCHKLEDWMATPEVAPILAREFVDLKIDNDRMKDASSIYDEYCKKKGGIPWFVFLTAEGKVVATSDRDGTDNVGFPAQPEEIAWFVEMLKKSRRHLSDADIEALKKSLEPKKPVER